MFQATLQAPAPAGPARFDQRFAASGERSSRLRVAALLAAAVAAVCAVSAAQRALLLHHGGTDLAAGTARDAIAALLWIPLGAAVLRLARRLPLRRENLARAIPVHLSAPAAAAFLLNLAWAAVVAVAGLWPEADMGFGTLVLRQTVGLFHANALIYGLLLAWAHMSLARAHTRANDLQPSLDEGGTAHAVTGSTAVMPRSDTPLLRIPVRHADRTSWVDVGAVAWFEAAGDYVRLHLPDGSHLIHARMRTLEARLDHRFVRVHRSAIVRLDRIREVRPRPAGDATLLLHDGTEVPLSRRRRAHVLARLEG